MRLVLGLVVAGLLLVPRMGLAQTAGGAGETSRFFVDANLFGAGWSPADDREFTYLFAQFGEVATFRAKYPKPSVGLSFLDLGGGVMFHRKLGVGVSVVRTTSEDTVGLEATIPHPVFLNSPASAAGVTDHALTRDETAIHIFVVYAPLRTDRAQIRFFGGPSYFRYSADMVNDISYVQQFSQTTPQNSITITGFTSERGTGDGWGYHVGGDYTYFFTRLFGVAGGVRFSYGTVTVDREPLSRIAQQIRVGTTAVFAGVRLRFGR